VVVFLANHGKRPADITVSWSGHGGRASADVGSASITRTDGPGGAKLRLHVPAEDVLLIRIATAKEDKR
jgi:hypothetical protein